MPSLRVELSKSPAGQVEKRAVQDKADSLLRRQAKSSKEVGKPRRLSYGGADGGNSGGGGGIGGHRSVAVASPLSSNFASFSSSQSSSAQSSSSSSSRRRFEPETPPAAAHISSARFRHSVVRSMAANNGVADRREVASTNGVLDLREMAPINGVAELGGGSEDRRRRTGSIRTPASKIGDLLDLDTAGENSRCFSSDPAAANSSNRRQETQIQSIRELINQYLAPVPESQEDPGTATDSPFKQCQRSGHGGDRDACTSCGSRPFTADIGVDTEILQNHHQSRKKLSFPRTFSWHLNPSKSMEGPLFWETMHRDAIASNIKLSSAEGPSPLRKASSARGAVAEIHSLSPLPSCRWTSCSSQSYSQKEKAKQSPQASFVSQPRNGSSRRLAEAKPCSVSPLSFGGYVEKADEFTPVSPPCRYTGEEEDQANLHWFASSAAQLPLYSPKLDYQSRSKSLGAKATLKSAVRNLEATFTGSSRAASVPKTSNPTPKPPSHDGGGDGRSEPSKLVQRLFTSPVKRRPKSIASSDTVRPIEKPTDLSNQLDRDRLPSTRKYVNADAMEHQNRTRCVNQMGPIIAPSLGCHQAQKISGAELSCKSGSRNQALSSSSPLLSPGAMPDGNYQPAAAARRFKDVKVHQSNGKFPAARCYLQCGVNDGMPFYTLFRNDSEEVLLARACDFNDHPSKQGCSGAYTFHSGKCTGKGAGGWRNWMRKENKTVTNLCGKMQVSTMLRSQTSSTIGSTDRCLVSEFVLFDARVEYAAVTGRSQSLRFVNMNRNSSRIYQSSFPLDAGIRRSPTRLGLKVVAMECSDAPAKRHQPSYSIDDSDLVELQATNPNLSTACQELAAIVVEMPAVEQHESHQETITRGWNAPDHPPPHRRMIVDSKASARASSIKCLSHVLGSQNVTVMLPREHHGLPDGRVCRPTSLIERWRCGGKCDCGGWDLGCGMKVFSTKEKSSQKASMARDRETELLSIYSQGKLQELVLSLSLAAQEGFFILSFQGGLSPLEAFATAVAMLHSRKPLLSRRS